MSARITAELGYLSETQTDAWIARESGIPRSTIGFVRRGERELPDEYRLNLRRVYQREAYARLRDTGFSAQQARRFSAYAPASATRVENVIEDKIQWLAQGYAATIQEYEQEQGLYRPLSSIIEEGAEKIRSGLRHSYLPYEEWETYGEEEAE